VGPVNAVEGREHRGPLRWAVVVPTTGGPGPQRLLDALAAQTGPAPVAVVVADDRRAGGGAHDDADRLPPPLVLTGGGACPEPVVVRSGGRGPAAARNAGWRALAALPAGHTAGTPVDWVAFVDDDVELPPTWSSGLAADLAAAGDRTGGIVGGIVGTVTGSGWAGAVAAYRAEALAATGGFDERSGRAHREHADLVLRVRRAGWAVERGARTDAPRARTADDRGGRHEQRDAAGVRRAVLASAAVPLAAVRHRARGAWRWRNGAQPWPGPAGGPLRAVLFDRDGTLVHDVPYNGDPAKVLLVDGAAEALARVRAAGIATGVVTNQSGIARGIITRAQADATTAEVVRQLGGVDVVRSCPHGPDDGCPCRKPAPGMVLAAAVHLGLAPGQVAVVGDTGADVGAARAAGARGVLVPTATTRPEDVEAARAAGVLAPDLSGALDLLLGSRS